MVIHDERAVSYQSSADPPQGKRARQAKAKPEVSRAFAPRARALNALGNMRTMINDATVEVQRGIASAWAAFGKRRRLLT